MEDDRLGRMLLDRGLLSPEEHADAVAAAGASGRPLAEVVVEKAYLSREQVDNARAAMQERVRFCVACRKPVLIPRRSPQGEKCPRCLGAIEWREERTAARIQELDAIVDIAHDQLPPDVEEASTDASRLFGKYILLAEVGTGGVGVV